MMTEDQIKDQQAEIAAKFGRAGVVRFEGHVFMFQQPNEQHARDYRRENASAATAVDSEDRLAVQLIVAFDEMCEMDPAARMQVRLAFRAWLKTRPLAIGNAWFWPVLSELLGQAEEGTAERAGKGCNVSSSTPKT